MTIFNKVPSILLPATLLAVSSVASADYSQGSTIDEATVLSADPVYRTVRINQPKEQCWDEKVATPARSGFKSHTPKILGAIIGAAVGNEFGSGRGRDLATAAGAVLGGSIGRDAQANHRGKHRQDSYSYQQRCEVVDSYHTEERLDGYDVTYRYNGQVGSTFTKHDPGSTIRVSVNVVPVE